MVARARERPLTCLIVTLQTAPRIHPDQRMDHLQEEASNLVEAVAKAEEDPGVTFYRLRELAYATLGVVLLSRAHGGPVRPSPAGNPRRGFGSGGMRTYKSLENQER